MKRLKQLITVLFLSIPFLLMAQVPQSFKYQGVARDVNGALLVNQNISLRLAVIDSAGGGVQVYEETHKTSTNQFGLYTVQVGTGIQPTGVFANIPWQTGNKWFAVELDPNAGSNFTFMGRSQLVSVPYALMALTAVNSDDADADPTNELISNVSFNSATNVLTISDAGNTFNIDLSSLAGGGTLTAGTGISINNNIISNTGDLSNTNELNTAFNFNPASNELSITDAGGMFTVDLSTLSGGSSLTAGAGIDISNNIITNTGDLSAINELITGFTFNPSTNQLSVTDAGGISTVDLSSLAGGSSLTAGTGIDISNNIIINTGDLDPTNEFNIAFDYDTFSKQLTITDGGASLSVDLSSLASVASSDNWTMIGNNLYNNNNGNIGVGTTTPSAKLHVAGNDGLLATGVFGTGTIPVNGAGTRLMWYPAKSAFRAGNVSGTQWDDANIANYSTAFGKDTRANGPSSLAAGDGSIASGSISTALGQSTNAFGDLSTAMGSNTNAVGNRSTATGFSSTAAGENSFSMGNQTIAAGVNSLAHGFRSTAAGLNSVALGNYANTNNNSGCFMFADNAANVPLNATGINQFIVRASGGATFYSNDSSSIGVTLTPGDNSWSIVSDKSRKENFRPVNGELILQKINKMELSTWNYIGQNPAEHRHYGPMAQDFYAAFGFDGIGTIGSEKMIATADYIGVSFTAIQALEKRTATQQQELEQLQQENQFLLERLNEIEKLLISASENAASVK